MPGRPSLRGPVARSGESTPGQAARRAAQVLLFSVSMAVVVGSLVGDRGLLQLWRARVAYRQLDRSIQTLKAENAALLERARLLREDPEAIEQLARQDLGLIRKGEIIVIVKESRPKPAPK